MTHVRFYWDVYGLKGPMLICAVKTVLFATPARGSPIART